MTAGTAVRYGIQPLAHKVFEPVASPTRQALRIAATDPCIGQIRLPIAGLKQHRSAIGTGMVLVKFSDDSRPRPIRKQDILSCAINAPAKVLVYGKAYPDKRIRHDRRLFPSPFMSYSHQTPDISRQRYAQSVQ